MIDGMVYVNGDIYEDDLSDPAADNRPAPDGTRILPHTEHDPLKAGQRLNREYHLAQALNIRAMTPELFLHTMEAALAADVGLDAGELAPDMAALRGVVDGSAPLPMNRLRGHLVRMRDHAEAVNAPYVVPEGYLFMMGDNRYNSADSRFWGPLDKELVRGKAIFIYWSWDGERTRPRLSRLGDLIR
ncbi:signal peptidase I [bacterium]|nr:signal peptidase I [bacterium]